MTPYEWLTELHGSSPGWLVICAIGPDKRVVSRWHPASMEAARRAAAEQIEATAPHGDIYVSCATYRERPEKPGSRGSAADVVAVPGVWLDLDVGEDGHKPRGNGLPNPPDVDTGLQILADAGFPAPTHVVLSGHGAQLWYLTHDPHVAEPEDIYALTMGFSARAVRVFEAAGYGLDNLGDPARILRPPGTFNHKRGDAKPVTLSPHGTGVNVSLETLLGLCEDVRRPRYYRGGPAEAKLIPLDEIDLFNQTMPWSAILEPHGWTYVSTRREDGAEFWARPGKDPSEGHSAVCGPHGMPVMVNFSGAAGLPVGPGQRLTKLRIYAHYNYGGDVAAAVAEIKEALHERLNGETE